MTFPLKIVGIIKGKPETILITMNMATPSTAGFTIEFASGNFFFDFKEGAGKQAFTSNVELSNTYTTPGTYIGELSGPLDLITKFIADNSKITFIENLKTVLLVETRINSNLYSGLLDLTDAPVSGIFQAYTQSSNFSILFAPSGNGSISNLHIGSSKYTGIVDFSNIPLTGGLVCNANPNATGFIFSSSGSRPVGCQLQSCNYEYVDFANVEFTRNSVTYRLQDNIMAAAGVNRTLASMASAVSGESGGGDYTGRAIIIDGTNAAPDGSSGGYDGTQAVIDLTGKGFIVTTS